MVSFIGQYITVQLEIMMWEVYNVWKPITLNITQSNTVQYTVCTDM